MWMDNLANSQEWNPDGHNGLSSPSLTLHLLDTCTLFYCEINRWDVKCFVFPSGLSMYYIFISLRSYWFGVVVELMDR